MGTDRRPQFKRIKSSPIRETDDDITIMRYVARHRFRRTSDIARHLTHRSVRRLPERLRLLYDHQYLDRPKAQQDDYYPNGKPEIIYALGNRGSKLLAELDGTTPVKTNWTDKNRTVKRPHIQHTLRIGDIEDAFDRLPVHIPTTKILSAKQILATVPSATARDPKPWLWQARIRTADGDLRLAKAIPDAVLGLDLTDKRKRFYFFCECDRATMPVIRTRTHSSSIVRKLEAYLTGFHTGLHQTRYAINNLRFLIITTTQKRIATMLDALQQIAGDKDHQMFLFADWQQVSDAPHVLAISWRDGQGNLVSLLD